MNPQQPPYRTFAYVRRRSRMTYVTTLLSIALVLLFLGLFAAMGLFGHGFVRYAREAIVLKVFLHDEIDQQGQVNFVAELRQKPYVQSLELVSKEAAARQMKERLGEDLLNLTEGVNPFLASIDLQLKGDYIQLDSLPKVRRELESRVFVAEVSYPLEMIELVSQRVQALSWGLLVVGVFLVVVVLYLVFGTIRLSIYAQRLTIRSMQLMGATHAFIRRPFLRAGLLQGGLAGGLAGVGLSLIWTLLGSQFEQLGLEKQFVPLGGLIAILSGIVLFGLALGFSGSYLAVNRFLDRNLDELM